LRECAVARARIWISSAALNRHSLPWRSWTPEESQIERVGPLQAVRAFALACTSVNDADSNLQENALSFHFIVHFQPLPGMEAAFREEVLRVNGPSRKESGCLRIDVFESIREPVEFAIHSEWVDEAAFDLHATLPHTVQFIAAAEKLLKHPVQGLRLHQIDGGPGSAPNFEAP
jgi:quinol monooxygenase YgiN